MTLITGLAGVALASNVGVPASGAVHLNQIVAA